MSDWRAVIEAAGGPERAMLYGRPLVALLAHVATVEAERDAALVSKAAAVAGDALAGEARAEAERLLAVERAALVGVRRELEAALAIIKHNDPLVQAAVREREVGVPSRALEDAITAWEAAR